MDAFTSAHRIPHGHAVWLSLPAVALCNAAVTDADCQDPRALNLDVWMAEFHA